MGPEPLHFRYAWARNPLENLKSALPLRQGDWVLIDAPTGDDNSGPQRNGEPVWLKPAHGYIADSQPGELFNAHDDLSERRNHYAEQTAMAQRLKTLLEQYKSQGRSRPGPVQQNM